MENNVVMPSRYYAAVHGMAVRHDLPSRDRFYSCIWVTRWYLKVLLPSYDFNPNHAMV